MFFGRSKDDDKIALIYLWLFGVEWKFGFDFTDIRVRDLVCGWTAAGLEDSKYKEHRQEISVHV